MIFEYKVRNEEYPSKSTKAGNRMEKQFMRVNDENGNWHLEECGEYDIQEAINSACPQSTSELLNRYLRGDVKALDGKEGEYGDVSEIGDLGECYRKASLLKYVTIVPDDAGKLEVEKTEVNKDAES